MRKIALILLILVAFCATALYAGTTGKLSGKVKDGSGKALGYVNISVRSGDKTVTGTQSKESGLYTILNIPPGTYSVKFSLVGFAVTTVEGVKISADATATVNATLQKQTINIKTVTITATPQKVDPTKSGSLKEVDVGGMGDVAVNDITGIIAMQAGVSNIGGELHVRGGRANEMQITIDGMSVSDPVGGGSALSVDTDAISSMQVMTGGFTAEYGNAQSGQVSIVTKDGDPFYSGKVEYSSDHVFLSSDKRFESSRNEDAFKFSLGGPVIPPFASEGLKDKWTFYLNGGGDWQDGRLAQYAQGDPNDIFTFVDTLGVSTPLLENDYPSIDPFSSRTQLLGVLDKGDRFYNTYNLNFKTKYAFNERQKVTLGIRGDRNTNDYFSYLWRYAPDFNGQDETNQKQIVANYDHVFNSSMPMNLKVKASYYQKKYSQNPKNIDRNNYLYSTIDMSNPGSDYTNSVLNGDYGYRSIDNNGDGIYDFGFNSGDMWTYRIPGVEDPRAVEGFVAPGTIYTTYIDDSTTTLSAKADFEVQLNQIHNAKTGIEIINHNIKKDQLFGFLTINETRRQDYLTGIYDMAGYNDTIASDTLASVPPELQDVVQTDDGYIPIYKPIDYYNAAYAASGTTDGYKANPWQAAYYLQDKMEWEGMIVNAGLRFDFWYIGSEYQIALDNGQFRTQKFAPKDRLKVMVSPRLGVSHPITEKDVLRFAYNYQNQIPAMAYVFTSKDTMFAAVNPGTTVGSPNLEPQITVTYEVGLSHQLGEDYVLDMTAYYKNLYNYVSTKKVLKPGEAATSWYQFISEDYGSSRGIDMQIEKSLSDFYSWAVSYSLAWAQGNNSSTLIQDENTNLREFPLDWDVRHNLNANYTFRIARGEEYIVPFTSFVLPVDDFSSNITWTMASGAPYTPATQNNSALDTNSKRKGYTQQANLRLTKGFTLPGKMYIRTYLDVDNLFKFPNVAGVFAKTGSAYNDGADISESDGTGYTFAERQFMHNLAIQDPANVNNFRTITVGMSFNF